MAEIDNVLAELRDRIMRPFEGGSPKPATQEVDGPVKHSAAVALRRLVHPGRDGGVVVEDDPVSAPIKPERGDGVVVGGDPISPLIRRLALDMPELMEEVVAFIERRIAELDERDDGAAPRPTESAPAALVRATPTMQDDDTGIATISLRFDTQVLARIDTAAKRLRISRTAWLHIAAGALLEAGDDPVVGKRDAGAARLGVAHR
jgi:hypothetical protein